MTLTELRSYVRDLTGVYATDLISDTLLTRWINEANGELYRSERWSWALVPLSSGSDSPTFDSQFHHILAYRVAAKVLGTQADDTQRQELYVREFDILLTSMRQYYFPRNAVGAVSSFSNLIQASRDLSGVNSDAVADNLFKQWINEAYMLLASRRDWDWLEQEFTATDVTAEDGPFTLPNGCRRVISCRVIDQFGVVEEVFERPDGVNVKSNQNLAYYDVSPAGVLTLLPEDRFTDVEPFDLYVRYSRAHVALSASGDAPMFESAYASILSYSAAIQALLYVGRKDDPRLEAYNNAVGALFEAMVSRYELSHDATSFQLGAEGREIQQYPYWLRRF